METESTAKIARGLGIMALVLSLFPVVIMFFARAARAMGHEGLRDMLAPLAFMAQLSVT